MNISEQEFITLTKSVMEEVLPPLVKFHVENTVNSRMAQFKRYLLDNIDSEINKAIREAVGKYYFNVVAHLKCEK